jgi:poly(A) polymerase
MKQLDHAAVLALPGVGTALELADRDGRNLYLVGGAIRDLCLRRAVKDADLIVEGRGENFAHTLAARLRSRVVLLGRGEFQTYRIPLLGGAYLDLWDLKSVPLREDLCRRDFTINAVAYHLQTGNWIDPTGGLPDLDHGLIRAVSDRVFTEDPLRLLRAVRFKTRLRRFSIEPSTLRAMMAHAHRIQKAAPERVAAELDLILGSSDPHGGILLLEETRLLESVVPELDGLKGVAQHPHNPDDVFDHTLACLHALPDALRRLPELAPRAPRLKEEERLLLAWALLCHDLGKPSTRSEDARGNSHFYNHQRLSVRLAEGVCRRLRFSRERTERVQALIALHSRPMQLALAGNPRRGLRRFVHLAGRGLALQLALFLADRMSRGDLDERAAGFVRACWELYRTDGEALISPPRLVSGEDVMETLGLAASPEVGRVMDSVLRLQVAGELCSREEALAYLRRLRDKRRARA